jgi:PAS domain S-box-containing protein
MQLRSLIEIVSRQYDTYENDRTSLETVMRLASDEATAMTERLERESVVRLQAILDHVKDGIISVDHLGRIESMNRTAERFFGVRQSDVMSALIDTLIPDIAPGADVVRALEGLAMAQETTHYDLAAREVVARHRRGELMPAEILVSAIQSKRRPTYIVCIRDTAERSKAEEALKDSEARYRVLVENAPEAVLRRLQRQRCRLLQAVARGPAAHRTRTGEPARAGRRHALVRNRPGAYRGRAAGRDAGVRVAAPGRRGQADPERGALRAPAELGWQPDPRQHHRHHRAKADRAGRGG